MSPQPPALAYDPELEAALKVTRGDGSQAPILDEKFLAASRSQLSIFTAEASLKDFPQLSHSETTIPGPHGDIIVSIYKPKTLDKGTPAPAIYNIHGGGYITGNRFMFVELSLKWAVEHNAIVIAPSYRLAPEHPDPAPTEDCFAGLKWTFENASDLGIDASKIVIAGGSAGGGLSAGCSLMWRDHLRSGGKGQPLWAQILIYPMLDDRNETISSYQFPGLASFSQELNVFAWKCLLGGKKDVSIYVAPARATDLSGLPQTFLDVGSAEVFRDEDVAFAEKLWAAGVQCELHVWPGAWHGFDVLAPNAKLSITARETRDAWVRRLFASSI